MPFSGGVFTRLYSWRTDRNASVAIDSTRMDGEDDGFAAGLSNAICRDGQSVITAAIPFSGNKITGLGNAAAGGDALNQQTGDGRYYRQAGGGITAVSAGTNTIDLSLGGWFYATATGAASWTFTNPPAFGTGGGFILELVNGGLGVQSWPAAVRWPGGVAPVLTTSGTDVLVFATRDGGLVYRANVAMRDSK